MMNLGAEHCTSFISSQFKTADVAETVVRRAVTLSRQAGCGAAVVGEKLAQYLPTRIPGDHRPWTVYDSNLIDKMLSDQGLPAYLSKILREDRVSQLEDFMVDAFGVHPPSTTLLQHVTETLLKLAGEGNVILIGRAGNMVTAKLPHVLHVRLVASLENRIEHCAEALQMTRDRAARFCAEEDHARKRYFKKYFNADIDDPLLYHMMINTGQVGYDGAARIIGDAVLKLA